MIQQAGCAMGLGRMAYPGSCWHLCAEMAYTGIPNVDLCLKASFIRGPAESESAEKPFNFELELRVGYYF